MKFKATSTVKMTTWYGALQNIGQSACQE